jgi:hypothetical protein
MTSEWAKSLARVLVARRSEQQWGSERFVRSAGQTKVPAAIDTIALIYELLDAHDDTARLVREAADTPLWDVHLEYLRRLQRAGREVLAGLASMGVTR